MKILLFLVETTDFAKKLVANKTFYVHDEYSYTVSVLKSYGYVANDTLVSLV